MTLEDLKKRATASELTLIEQVEKLVLESKTAAAASQVERDLKPAKRAAGFMRQVLNVTNRPDHILNPERLSEKSNFPFRDAVVSAANQFFKEFPELRNET